MAKSRKSRWRPSPLIEASPLRSRDPRIKLVLALCASLAVMLSMEKLIVASLLYIVLLAWAKLLPAAGRQIWRMKWILIGLFIGDWILVSLDLAVIVTMRLMLLAGSFTLFFVTTTSSELCRALEWMRVPYRYAFSLSLTFQSLGLLEDEWRSIGEAQRARGAWTVRAGDRKKILGQIRELVSLAVPAVVLTTKRAWTITEAAYARGFDSPNRRPFTELTMEWQDWFMLSMALALSVALFAWR